jgi:hypothetical protein
MKMVLIIVIFLLVIASLGTFQYIDGQLAKEKADTAGKTEEQKPAEQKELEKKEITKEKSDDQSKEIGGVTYDLNITIDSTEDEIIAVMHKMTHQKVEADDKWGAIPMTEDTIQQVQQIIAKKEFNQSGMKDELQTIIQKWQDNDFSTVDQDHNYFWNYQGGTVGKAYGVMSKEDEEEFIRNNFK